eukprot:scaffold173733_cov35-Tisochrysis_lutea.AAC.2
MLSHTSLASGERGGVACEQERWASSTACSGNRSRRPHPEARCKGRVLRQRQADEDTNPHCS